MAETGRAGKGGAGVPVGEFLRNPDGSLMRIDGKVVRRPGGQATQADLLASDWMKGKYWENPRYIGTVASAANPQVEPWVPGPNPFAPPAERLAALRAGVAGFDGSAGDFGSFVRALLASLFPDRPYRWPF